MPFVPPVLEHHKVNGISVPQKHPTKLNCGLVHVTCAELPGQFSRSQEFALLCLASKGDSEPLIIVAIIPINPLKLRVIRQTIVE